MFAALLLAEKGFAPIIIERGSRVEKRIEQINDYWNGGKLNLNSNVQFGEGGAGTFSDGKLNTGIKDKQNRISFVLETFVKFGADESIVYDSKPHVGTDVLAKVVKNIRNYIIDLGGKFLFDTALTDIELKDNKLSKIFLSDGNYIETDICILAIGHSARDTFEMLLEHNVSMEQKPFAIGVRVEHNQSDINTNQYGISNLSLPAANYKLTYKAKDGRGVYSFCMCPGGFVVNASSEEGRLAINGMSYQKRDGKNANSAIVVTVLPEDFPDDNVLSGMSLQRQLEERAFNECNGLIPVQKFVDFRNNTVSNKFGKVSPSIKGKYNFGNINNILPKYICDDITEALEHWNNKIKHFGDDDVILSAIESRTSSPVRIIRNETFQSNIEGLYPAGEGAGYAGGITSAAIDSMKIFEQIASVYRA